MPNATPDQAAVESVLKQFPDPESGRGVLDRGQVRDIRLGEGKLALTLELTTHSAPLREETRRNLHERLAARFPQLAGIDIDLGVHDRPPGKLGQIGLTAKSVIAVGSGKGGVGKSTVAACLAIGLKRAGCRVGLMDADIYGPSIPHLLGLEATNMDVALEGPDPDGKKLKPIDAGGLAVMSMGFLVPKEQAVAWRGPMLHGAITQFLRDTKWGDLDYLVIDMPPGTGDIAITLSQALPLTGSVVVCTPQEVALLDAVKAIGMFRMVKIPILGVVENMSGFICPSCEKRYDIFGSGGAREKAEEMGVPFLGEVPINIGIREHGDAGSTEANFDNPILAPYLDGLVFRLAKHISDTAAAAPPQPSLPVL